MFTSEYSFEIGENSFNFSLLFLRLDNNNEEEEQEEDTGVFDKCDRCTDITDGGGFCCFDE